MPKYFPQSGLKLARGGPAGWREGLAAEQQELCTPQAAAAAAAEQAGSHAEPVPAALACAGAAWPGLPHALPRLQEHDYVCM